MAGVRVGIQQAEVANEARAQRVQVNIPDQLQQVGFLLAKDRLVAVLEKMP
jgi:hypothetical protein